MADLPPGPDASPEEAPVWLLDGAVLDDLRELGFGSDLVEIYLSDTAVHMEILARALPAGDAAEVERAAHALKGSNATVGATMATRICAEIERMASEGAIEEAALAFERLRDETKRVEQALRDLPP